MILHPHVARYWVSVGSIVTGAVAVAALGVLVFRRRPTQAQIEERRRLHLAQHGRIVDGAIIDAAPSEQSPQTIVYRYRIAGVTYECSQDVSAISPHVEAVRLEFPVQVRYNRTNPGDSIVVAENWNGLWNSVRQ